MELESVWPVVVHPLFEVLAFGVGFWLYRRARCRRGDFLTGSDRATLIIATLVGAWLGSKVLHHLAHPSELGERLANPILLLQGQAIVGALLGGVLGCEIAKKLVGIVRSTGDLYAVPLAVGIAIGRVGCFLTGLPDGTHGVPTTFLLGVDYGDGLLRHPTQLYEVAFALALATALARDHRHLQGEGARFRGFMIGYLSFRFAIDFLKPYEPVVGLNPIQWACALGLCWYLPQLRCASSAAVAHG